VGQEQVSIKSAVISEIQQVAQEHKKDLPPLTDELLLLDSGLDSLGIAIVVTRLDDALGFDPFTDSDNLDFPVTVGDFIRLYENAARSRAVDSRRAD
jgi:acyl carrier protein